MHTYRIFVSKKHFLSLRIGAPYLSSGKTVKYCFHMAFSIFSEAFPRTRRYHRTPERF